METNLDMIQNAKFKNIKRVRDVYKNIWITSKMIVAELAFPDSDRCEGSSLCWASWSSSNKNSIVHQSRWKFAHKHLRVLFDFIKGANHFDRNYMNQCFTTLLRQTLTNENCADVKFWGHL